MGALAYVRKPFDAGILIGTVEDIAAEHVASDSERSVAPS
jgi:hypothetical protein